MPISRGTSYRHPPIDSIFSPSRPAAVNVLNIACFRTPSRGRIKSACLSDYRSDIIKGSCGTNSVVECDLAKVEVASSNLVSRSFQQHQRAQPCWAFLRDHNQRG